MKDEELKIFLRVLGGIMLLALLAKFLFWLFPLMAILKAMPIMFPSIFREQTLWAILIVFPFVTIWYFIRICTDDEVIRRNTSVGLIAIIILTAVMYQTPLLVPVLLGLPAYQFLAHKIGKFAPSGYLKEK